MEVGDAGRGDGFDETETHVLGQCLEEGPAAAEQDRHLVEDHLVDQGVLERRPYDQRPRHEYHLTEKGAELIDLLMVMTGWGDKWLAGEAGPPVLYRHHACGEVSGVDLRCAHCGDAMHANDVDLLPGPGTAG